MIRPKAPRGFVVYDGLSLLDGRTPIVAIVTLRSANRKTGDMAQLWILVRDRAPQASAHAGIDASICGDCPLRGRLEGARNVDRGCYVALGKGPTMVWRAYQRGRYPAGLRRAARALAGARVRLGAYGDPAAVPRGVLEALTARAAAWTGYTHQWRLGFALQDLVMASAESAADVRDAEALGYRCFRIVAPGEPRAPGHMVCPSSTERGYRLTCAECSACRGTAGRRSSHVQIAAHGLHPRHALAVVG